MAESWISEGAPNGGSAEKRKRAWKGQWRMIASWLVRPAVTLKAIDCKVPVVEAGLEPTSTDQLSGQTYTILLNTTPSGLLLLQVNDDSRKWVLMG